MADSPLDSVLGEEIGAAEATARGASASGEAAAISAALDLARGDAAVATAAAAFLREQTRLIREQRRTLGEEDPLVSAGLREGRLRRAGLRLRNVTQACFTLAAVAVVLAVAGLVWKAANSRSVVVDVFKAPSSLAGRGLTGDVIASDVLDELQKLQAATRATTAGLSTAGVWATEIKINVPAFGVSIGEIDRVLHDRLARDIHVGGELVQTESGGLALTVRGDGVPAKTFEGGAGDLAGLAAQAAEHVYARSQPVRYAAFLTDSGRSGDALAFLPGAFARAGSDLERAELANRWGDAYTGLDEQAQALAKHRMTMALAPRLSGLWWTGWGNVIADVAPQGEEPAWRESRAMLDEVERARPADRPETRLLLNAAQLVWDMPLLVSALLDDAARSGGAGEAAAIVGPQLADAYALVHDPAQAARWMAASAPDDPTTKAESQLLQGYDALDRGDAAAAAAALDAFYAAWRSDPNLQSSYIDQPCYAGLADGLAGRVADAEAVFARIGPWSRCQAFHGDVLARAGDAAGANRVWAEGLATTPDLPWVHLRRGLAELGGGDLAAAAADFAAAHAGAPHFADPLKASGDVLARQGRPREAVALYDEALRYSPAWTELRQAREAARAAGG